MKNLFAGIFGSGVLVALGLTLLLALAGCQTGRSLDQEGLAGKTEQNQTMSQQGVGQEGQLPGEESTGNEPQLRPQGEGGWENPNQ